MPKPEKGFEIDFTNFTMSPKEEALLKVGWVPQNGTPLRETVYVKFGKLSTKMFLIGTSKVPPGMIDKTQVKNSLNYQWRYFNENVHTFSANH